jgi:alpha-tubulin suppressor-like RCC1 family protein
MRDVVIAGPGPTRPRGARPTLALVLAGATSLSVALATAACGGEDRTGGLTGPEFGDPAALAFATGPDEAALGDPVEPAVRVEVRDASGRIVLEATPEVTLALAANPSGAGLAGTTTVSAVEGVATFEDVAVDRVGEGYTLSASAEGLEGVESGPFDVRFLLATLDVGVLHTCGTSPAGAGWCWGRNDRGQLGVGEAGPPRDVPAPVAGGLSFAAVRGGDNHTCALTTDAEPRCWGWDTDGQRGDGQVGQRDTVAAPAPVVGGHAFASLVAGGSFTCALTSEGAAWCWGDNGNGQLGIGSTGAGVGEPTPVDTDLRFDRLTAGSLHVCGLTPAGEAWCWGRNEEGQLGTGTAGDPEPTPVAVAGDLELTALAAGGGFTCGVAADGAAWCWGSNGIGALGDGNAPTDSAVPVEVAGDLSFRSVAAGGSHVCALTVADQAWCWGFNGSGQLGDGNEGTDRDVPTAVLGGHLFRAVTAGESSTCALTDDGAAWCWGADDFGQLGDGSEGTPADRPVRVVAPGEVGISG